MIRVLKDRIRNAQRHQLHPLVRIVVDHADEQIVDRSRVAGQPHIESWYVVHKAFEASGLPKNYTT